MINIDKDIVKDLFQLWQDLSIAGELSIGKNFNENYTRLKERVNKYYSLHNVIESNDNVNDKQFNFMFQVDSTLVEIWANTKTEAWARLMIDCDMAYEAKKIELCSKYHKDRTQTEVEI